MKKCLLTTVSLMIMCFMFSFTCFAAPKAIPDGGTFDAEFYAATYPDVVAAVGVDETALYNHYLTVGKAEGKLPYEGFVAPQPAPSVQASAPAQPGDTAMVWISETGKKYHKIDHCGRMNPAKARSVTVAEAKNLGLDACDKCY